MHEEVINKYVRTYVRKYAKRKRFEREGELVLGINEIFFRQLTSARLISALISLLTNAKMQLLSTLLGDFLPLIFFSTNYV